VVKLPSKVPDIVKSQVIKQCLSGDQRDKIAYDNGLSGGTVTNIVNEWRRELGFLSADHLRDLAVTLKKIGLSPVQCAIGFKVATLMNRLGVNEDMFESFMSEVYDRCKNLGLMPENIASYLTDLLEFSKKVPFSQISDYIQHKTDEKKRLEQETERLKDQKQTLLSRISELETLHTSDLEDMKMTDERLKWFSNLKEECARNGIAVDDIGKLTKVIKGAKELGYDPVNVTSQISNLEVLSHQYQYYNQRMHVVKVNMKL
jgi:hypothetical protein